MANKWLDIVFMQGDEAQEALGILDNEGERAALDHLLQWDYGDVSEERYCSPSGECDSVYRFRFKDGRRYEMSYNTSLEYIGLCAIVKN